MPGMGDLRNLEYAQQLAAEAARQRPPLVPQPVPTPATWPGEFYPPPLPPPRTGPVSQDEFYTNHLRPYEPVDAQALIDYTQRTRYLRPDFMQGAPPINFAHYANPDYRPNLLGWYNVPVPNADRSQQVYPDGRIRIVELPGASQVNNFTADTLVHELGHYNDQRTAPPLSEDFPWALKAAVNYQYAYPPGSRGLVPQAYQDARGDVRLWQNQVPYFGDPAEIYARLASDFSYNPNNVPQELWPYFEGMFNVPQMPRYPLQPINANSTPVAPRVRPVATPVSTPQPFNGVLMQPDVYGRLG
jgi:hypothetical protein